MAQVAHTRTFRWNCNVLSTQQKWHTGGTLCHFFGTLAKNAHFHRFYPRNIVTNVTKVILLHPMLRGQNLKCCVDKT